VNIIEASLSHALQVTFLIFAIWVDNKLQCCVVKYVIIIEALVLMILSSGFWLIHYVHLTNTHFCVGFPVNCYGHHPDSHSLIVANSTNNQTGLSLGSGVRVESSAINEARMKNLVNEVL
jgi:hypothetical protein